MNRSKIGWCDHTWNPITGCWHDCPYCYARKMTARFSGDVRLNLMANKDYSLVPAADGGEGLYVLDAPMMNETGSPLVYPFGFAPTLHRYRMDVPRKLKMGSIIFVGAMSDMFGAWVPDGWIKEVFGICQERPIHNYLFLTKNPERYERCDAAGMLPMWDNMWYGSTLTRPEDRCFTSNVHHTFWSIEPMHAPFPIQDMDGLSPDWVIIGAETGHRKGKIVPAREWIDDIVGWCDRRGIPVYMKDSLIPIVGGGDIRREFPEQLKHPKMSPKMEKKLIAACGGCKARMRKKDMAALLVRCRRGETGKQIGFLCRSCLERCCKDFGLDAVRVDAMIGHGDTDG